MRQKAQHSLPAKQQPDATALLNLLEHFHPVSPAIAAFLKKHCEARLFRRGRQLVQAGRVCEKLYFIQRGAVRGFVKEGRKEITTWISVENELVTSISGIDAQLPSEETIQALEDTYTLALEIRDLEHLYGLAPEFNIITRKILQRYYRDAERRALIARLSKAENRYRHFVSGYPHLINRIPLKYIASFLGLSLETISRIRKKLSTAEKNV